MSKFYLIGFAVLLFFDTVAQCTFKITAIQAGQSEFELDWFVRVFTNKWVYVSILGYILTFFTWLTLLKKAPVGPAFAASHLEIVTVMIMSVWLFDDRITFGQFLGAALILSGILFLALAEKRISVVNNPLIH